MIVQIAVALLATIIATLTDLKKREVPDFISYFLIAFGIGSAAIISVFQLSIYLFLYSIAGAVLLYAFGAGLYYTGVWGGGDAKLLTGFGATLASFPAVVAWPFLLTILFNILFFGAVFGVVFSIYLAVKHRKKFAEEARKILQKFKAIVFALYAGLAIVLFLYFIQKLVLITSFVWASAVVLFYLFIGLKAIENACMYRFIAASKLVEGDWIAEPVKFRGKIVYKPEKTGISIRELEKLKKLKIKQIKIKDGLPYIPAFLAALIVSLLGKDIMFLIFASIL